MVPVLVLDLEHPSVYIRTGQTWQVVVLIGIRLPSRIVGSGTYIDVRVHFVCWSVKYQRQEVSNELFGYLV